MGSAEPLQSCIERSDHLAALRNRGASAAADHEGPRRISTRFPAACALTTTRAEETVEELQSELVRERTSPIADRQRTHPMEEVDDRLRYICAGTPINAPIRERFELF
jgi:hypothetical protein